MADLRINVTARDRTGPAFKSVEDGMGRLEDAGTRIRGIADKAALAIGAIATAGIGLGTKLVTDLVDTAAEVRNLSESAGLSEENLQAWGRIAEESGGDISDIADSARELSLRLAEAANLETGPAVDALQLLGLKLEELEGLNTDEKFALIRDRLSEVTEESDRTFIAEELLGGASERLAGVVALTTEEFRAQTEAAKESGRVLTEEQLTAAEDAEKGIRDMKDALGGAASEITVALLPAVTSLSDFITDTASPAISGIVEWLTEHDTIARALGITLGGVATAILAVSAGTRAYTAATRLARAAAAAWHLVEQGINAVLRARPALARAAALANAQAAGTGGAASRVGRVLSPVAKVARVAGAAGLVAGLSYDLHKGILRNEQDEAVIQGYESAGVAVPDFRVGYGQTAAAVPNLGGVGARPATSLAVNVQVEGSVISEGDLRDTIVQTVAGARRTGSLP